MDMEKVIKDLHDIAGFIAGRVGIEQARNFLRTIDDTVILLKEQEEAVEPQTQPSAKGYWYTCGACGWWLFEVRDTVHFDDRKRIRFCASCGKAVKWE